MVLRSGVTSAFAVFIVLLITTNCIRGESLTPPYFNLAEGKNITATATCGEGIEEPELYCKLIGANSDTEISENVLHGQYCDFCDPSRPDKRHPPEYAVDGMETWWQSPPLSRGMKYNEVNLTIDLGQEFHVAYVYIRMANSPRPGLWILEKSADYGKTFTPWQYFAESVVDCENNFGKHSLQSITRDDSVICSTEHSKIVPLEGGEIPISLLQKRPSSNHYFNSTILQEWTRATNVRLRFLRTKNLLGHLMSVAKQDSSVTRRYFYSIKDISIGGRCMCNGHADACDIPDPRDNKVLLCRCKHNTCGAKCNVCCPGFEQKAWRQSKHDAPFRCEPCNCFLHSNECVYDKEVDEKHLSLDIHGRYSGGGVCQNCQHYTEGINCNKCISRFYRPYDKHWNETDVCRPCQCENFYSTGNCAEGSGRCECRKEFTPPNCDKCSFGYYDYPDCKPCECFLNGTYHLQCSALDGQCNCLPNFGGKYCKECAPGYFNFPECKRCECNAEGSVSEECDETTGACTCKNKYAGLKCDQCSDGYYYANNDCTYCNCDTSGTEPSICNKETGQCICKPGYGGDRCDTCVRGYYGYPDCQPCNCSKVGSHGTTCSAAGKCSCLGNYAGKTCSQCSPGYYSYPDCKSCECDDHGSNGISCDQEGRCECHKNFDGQHCDKCKEGYYNFPACEDCNCHPAGVIEGFPGCGSVPLGELCKCKDRIEGRICNKCKPLYWNLNIKNPDGCEDCRCNSTGVLGGIGVCDIESGQCVCKPSVISRSCSECVDGTYGLTDDNLFGCQDCGCDVGGSVSNICHKTTGQCICQSRVTGRTCKEPLRAHYFPTLYQYQYEVEDGHTAEYNRVRYGYDERIFPNYSWKGYATFSSLLQKEVIHDIYIPKSSLYRMVFRFVNPNPNTVIGGIRITPENPNDIEQYIKVQFRNTSEPAFVSVSGDTGNIPKPFVMNPGRWSVSINVNHTVYLDYFVLLPEDFYLATILNQKVEQPCTLDELGLCRHYGYPNITTFDKSWGVGGYVQGEQKTDQLTEWFEDRNHLDKIKVFNKVPLLNSNQPDISFNVSVRKTGPYVIVVNYVTPVSDLRTHDIDITAYTKNGVENGHLKLYSCPYSTMCRQVVTNDQLGVAIYEIDSSFITVSFKSTDANVGIHSVYVIPYDEWSLDYIKPKPVCLRKNGTCITASFQNPPETKTIQFEQEIEGELGKNRPAAEDNGVWLTASETTIDLKGKVANPGYYTFILHYYQPNLPAFDLDVIIQNGQFYEAKVPLYHCPSESGCRSVISQEGRNIQFSLTENFMITFKQPENKNVFLDYILVVPTDLYNVRNLEEVDLDRTGEFISMCGNNHFNVDTTHEGFCRDSVFSITAAHNTGALTCNCDYDGSLSFECEKFGGQCQCKDNIIGRRCEACKTGYYGFPDCKPCNCPSTAYCEPGTGQCICPEHVIGERCDQCEPYTFGYDALIGCEECKCHPLGVNGTTQCDLLSGKCPCKENVVGRPCDQCKAGHYFFPVCDVCECDYRGTTAEICDQVSAECFCKPNVIGVRCDFCREGSFNLQADNEQGCTECFCFGKTTRCRSSELTKMSLIQMKDWKTVAINNTDSLNITVLNFTIDSNEDAEFYRSEVSVDFTGFNLTQTVIYFSAPRDYLGKKLVSYGGFLNYTIFYAIGQHGSAVSGADVILEGVNSYLTYSNFEQPPPHTEFVTTLQLVESNFDLPTGVPSKREHIMEVLKDLRGIYIRATYWTVSFSTKLINVAQDEAIETEIYENTPLALSVEQCLCPPNYQGTSCEECAPGYYRIQSGPHGGFCVPCDCHGHATECDVNTGRCLNCAHNTRGDHCELCDVGYHGNALAGTPRDCLICACPLPVASNNFATSCDVSSDGEKISCECTQGYFGARCQGCAPGFYGMPEKHGDYCKPCQCSGNINPHDPTSCDTVTGVCLRCLNNTFGEACSLCAPGYFGDAINLKDCQACICDKLGTDHCDSHNGRCVCKPNVIGEKCDRCEVEHYGFESGRGCSLCACAEASDSAQCDDTTGQCKCKPGVTGRTCNRCAAGYWNYTLEGCISCGCKNEYSLGFGCNALTGQCECLQGVVGEKCDQCPHRWAFVPEFGCHQCDSCHHALLDETDKLAAMIDPIIIEFDSTQSGYFTRRRLDSMREQLEQLVPKLNEVNPTQTSLNSTIQELESLEQDSKNLNRKSNYSLENSDALNNQSSKLKDKLEILLDEIFETDEDALRIIEEIEKITGDLRQEAANEVSKALQEGQALLDAMKIYNLTGRENDAKKQLERVEEVLKNVTNYKLPVQDLQKQVDKIKGDLKMFNDKLDDLDNHTQYSLNMANEAESIIGKSGKDRLKGKLSNIENQIAQSQTHLDDSRILLSNASDLLKLAMGILKDLEGVPIVLQESNKEFEGLLNNSRNELENVVELQPEVQDHSKKLYDRVQQLEQILAESQFGSNDAVKAARAYKDIVAAVRKAREAAEGAQNDTTHAADILDTVQDETNNAEIESTKALETAYEWKQFTDHMLKPNLSEALNKYRPVKGIHNKNIENLKELEKILDNIHVQDLSNVYKETSNNAQSAANSIYEVDDVVNTTFVNLPKETTEARSLAKELDDTKKNLIQTEKQINTTRIKFPEVVEALETIPEVQNHNRQMSDEILASVEKLNQQIALARDIANGIKVGVEFAPSTHLELRNPKNLDDLAISTKFSGYFKTSQMSGLLFYIGNTNGTNLPKTNSDDYIALLIENGYPTLKYDVGNGVDTFYVDKYVSDDKWYQYIVEKVNDTVTLKIKGENEGIPETFEKQGQVSGPATIFNLDKEKSKIFVGGFPPDYNIQSHVRDINPFQGDMEDIVIGNTPVSLWNFVDGEDNNRGATERDSLVILAPSTGYRFNGDGFIILDARSLQIRSKSIIEMKFKTSAPNGLLFLAGRGRTFVSLELKNGFVVYQYNLGGKTKKWATAKTYHDGKWHKISATRDGPKGRLMVDSEEVLDRTNPIEQGILEPIETISIGGHPEPHNYSDVTRQRFDGCISNVTIMEAPIDLRSNIQAYGITPGCTDKFASMVSFNKEYPGYLGWDRISVAGHFYAILRFRTVEENGLIFYVANPADTDETKILSLSLKDGRLVFNSQKKDLISTETFNDNQWHVVSLVQDKGSFKMTTDDFNIISSDSSEDSPTVLYANMYVGGLPDSIKPKPDMAASIAPFSGCIADLIVQGQVKNFANTSFHRAVRLDKCDLDTPAVHVQVPVQELPPTPPPREIFTSAAESSTLNPHAHIDSGRGDGGIDEGTLEPTDEVAVTQIIPHIEERFPPPKQPGTIPTTTKAPVIESCALPLHPLAENKEQVGYRFGTKQVSKLEFAVARGKYKKTFEFRFEFRSKEEEGLLLYIENKNHKHYVAVYLQNGYVVFTFKGENDAIVIRSTKALYHDDEWHLVEVSRDLTRSKLVVDQDDVNESNLKAGALDITVPFYFGGVPLNITQQIHPQIQINLNGILTFNGCIRGMSMNDKPLETPIEHGVIPCSDNVEDGTFFNGDAATYMKLKEKFKVGQIFTITMEIKPRVNSGLLVAAHGKKDYYILELHNGDVRLTVDNGKGPVTTVFYHPQNNTFHLCNGQWHRIQAVKSKNVVTLSVDNIFSDPKIGSISSISADTGSALFLGGHRFLAKVRGILSRTPYMGCIKNVEINNEPVQLSAKMVQGNVSIGYCPKN